MKVTNKVTPRDRMTGTMRDLAFKPYSIFTLTVLEHLVKNLDWESIRSSPRYGKVLLKKCIVKLRSRSQVRSRSGPSQVPGQVQKVKGLRTKDLDLG